MELNLNQNASHPPKYLSFNERFILSLVVAIYIVTEGQSSPMWVILVDPNVYITIIFSIAIALMLISLIHWETRILDRYVRWELTPNKRIALQLLCCALFPIMLDLVLVKFFFWLFRYDFQRSRYDVSEFPLVKLLIYAMNVCYYFMYVNHLKAVKTADLISGNSIAATMAKIPELPIPKHEIPQTFIGVMGINNRVIHVKDLLCFKRESGTAKVWLTDNTIWFVDLKTEEFEKMLDPVSFFKINRNVIVAFSIIESYQRIDKRHEVTLKKQVEYSGPRSISRDRYASFKKAFETYMEKKYS